MQIVIDMSEHEYEVALRDGWIHTFYSEKIKNGTPLPKGHGRLIDADAIEIDLHNKAFNNAGSKKYYEIVWAYKQIHNAPTIIEADKEVGE